MNFAETPAQSITCESQAFNSGMASLLSFSGAGPARICVNWKGQRAALAEQSRSNPAKDSRRTRDARVWRMRKGISNAASAEDRIKLAASVRDRGALPKHVRRGRIDVLAADSVCAGFVTPPPAC
jgi:hypothetical protein